MAHGKVPHDLQKPQENDMGDLVNIDATVTVARVLRMDRRFDTHDTLKIATVARRFLVEMLASQLLTSHVPGYLVVEHSSGALLLAQHIDDSGYPCPEEMVGRLRERFRELQAHQGKKIILGLSSSETSPVMQDGHGAAVVATPQLVIGYISRHGGNALADEAIAMMIAIRAGLLSKHSLRKRYCNRHLSEHNPHLRQLIDTITWTN